MCVTCKGLMGASFQEEMALSKHLENQMVNSLPGQQCKQTAHDLAQADEVKDLQRQLKEQTDLNSKQAADAKRALERANAARVEAERKTKVLD